MATFNELRRRTNAIAQEITDLTGVKKNIVVNLLQYAKQLPRPSNPDLIDELIFTAQMNFRFGISSRFHIQLIFEAVREKTSKYIRVEDYVKMICIFYSTNLELKTDFVFTVYDYQKTGFIHLQEMNMLLKTTIVQVDEEPEEQLKELIDIVISLMDTDGDGKISRDEFRGYVNQDILFIQLLGPVLPLERDVESFIDIVRHRTVGAVREFFSEERGICLHEPMKRTQMDTLYPVQLEIP